MRESLEELLEAVAAAAPRDRIGYRDRLAAYGQDAIEPMAVWLTDAHLGPFAVRVLERLASDPELRDAAVGALVSGRSRTTTSSTDRDIEEALVRLGATVQPGKRRQTWPGTERLDVGRPRRAQRAYWAMHTWERSEQGTRQRAYIWSELQQGRLRQGWGWDPVQDLRSVLGHIEAGITLTPEEEDAWHARRMLTELADAIHVDDIVVAVAVPEPSDIVVTRVIGSYTFDLDPGIGEYGHCLPIEVVAGPLPRHDQRISEALRGALRNRTRLWRIDRVGGDLEDVIKVP